MRKLFASGAAFFVIGVLFLLVSLRADRPAVFISLSVVWFILGLAVRKKNATTATDAAAETDAGEQ